MASFACIECHELHLSPKRRMPTESTQRGHVRFLALKEENIFSPKTYDNKMSVSNSKSTLSILCTLGNSNIMLETDSFPEI